MGVLDELAGGAIVEPIVAERAGTPAEEGVRLEELPRDVPILRTVLPEEWNRPSHPAEPCRGSGAQARISPWPRRQRTVTAA